jgi:hypothetical protein
MKILICAATIFTALLLSVAQAGAEMEVKDLCGLHYPSDDRIAWQCRKLNWDDTPQGLLGDRWRDILRFNRLDRRHFIGRVSIKVPDDPDTVRAFTPLPAEYPDAASDAKFILVDQSEMFLGAYEYGRLVFSTPVALGEAGHRTPNGAFRIDAVDRTHVSNLYSIAELGRPYPMHYALRFFRDKSVDGWPSYYIHGRDVPGYPASHGCIGLYDEEMQKEYYDAYDRKVNRQYYRELTPPYLEGAKRLYEWVMGDRTDTGRFHRIDDGPRVLITGTPPI